MLCFCFNNLFALLYKCKCLFDFLLLCKGKQNLKASYISDHFYLSVCDFPIIREKIYFRLKICKPCYKVCASAGGCAVIMDNLRSRVKAYAQAVFDGFFADNVFFKIQKGVWVKKADSFKFFHIRNKAGARRQ